MELLHLLQIEEIPIFQQLQIEEAILRTDSRNWCILNHGSPPAIVLGISGEIQTLVNINRFRQKPIPLIRRFSGGGTVVVNPDTCFITFICNHSFAPISPFPIQIMEWSSQFYRPLFEGENFDLKENDYILKNKKFGGNAQSICKNRWLHHSSLLWDYDRELMDYLSHPPKTPHYRAGRKHDDFLCTLKEFWPEKKEFMNQFQETLSRKYATKRVNLEEVGNLLHLPHRKATRLEPLYW